MPDYKETATRFYEALKAHDGDEQAAYAAIRGPQEAPEADALRQLQQERVKLTGGVAAGQEPPVDPIDAAFDAREYVRRTGQSNHEQQKAFVQTIFDAALAGDARVVMKPGEDRNEANERWLEERHARMNRFAQRQQITETVRGGKPGMR